MFKIFYGVLLSALILIVSIACEKEKEALYRYDSETNQYENVLENDSPSDEQKQEYEDRILDLSFQVNNALQDWQDCKSRNLSNPL